MSDRQSVYAFENVREIQRARLAALEAVFDPGTRRVLDACGVAPGWRCLEVGAGGGSIAAWLCERVGPEGAVVATDLDVTVLRERAHPGLEVRVHDVLRDPLPDAAFDLVHVRLLLAWLPDPPAAIARLVAALKPGGLLVAEEVDFASGVPDPRLDPAARDLFARAMAAHHAALAARHGFDAFYGRRLAGDLADAGLAGVADEGRASIWRAGEPGGRLWPLTFVQLREAMAETGLVSAAEVDAAIALSDAPGTASLSPVMLAAWGARPGA